ncbi:MAG: molecular chaperone GrpE [Acidimicrobiales bacterium]|jgi:molecular chaperone GrpE
MTQPSAEGATEDPVPVADADAPPSSDGEAPVEGFGTGVGDAVTTGPAPQGAGVGDVTNPGPAEDDAPLTVEGLVESLEQVTIERDGYFDSLARLQAEFENYRKAVAKRESDARERANEGLASELLPVLDACDGAIANGAEDVGPVQHALIDALTKQGLTRLEPEGAPFDPEQHEAVLHEDSTDGGGPVVAEVLRAGYQWKGRTLRAAMVRVKG